MTPVGAGHRDLLIGPGWVPSDLTAAPALFRRGLRATAVTRDVFEGTGFTRLLYDGAEFVGYATATHLVHQLTHVLARPRPPRVVFLYWADLDTDPASRGAGLPVVRDGDGPDRRPRGPCRRRTPGEGPRAPSRSRSPETMGRSRADPSHSISVQREPSLLREMIRPLAGDRRAGFFAAREGRVGALTRALRLRLAEGTPVLGREVAAKIGVFGPRPFHPEFVERVGDVIAFVRSPESLTYLAPGAPPPKRFLTGAHGGVEADELLVPLITGTLDELAVVGAAPASKR